MRCNFKRIKLTTMRTEKFQSHLMDIQDNMLNFAFMLTSNRDDAYDLLHDTTAAALRGQGDIDDDANFKGWVLGIMRSIFNANYVNLARHHSAHTTTPLSLNISSCEYSLPEGCYDEKELSRCIKDVPEAYRNILVLHIKGFSTKEIAHRACMPMRYVMTHICHAFQHFTSHLSQA